MVVKYNLQWKDRIKATDPRIKTSKTGLHTYAFEAESDDDARQIVRTFMLISAPHNFRQFELKNLKTGEKLS